jgi:signal transduction histidine kinase
MNKPLRVLMIEDDARDAEILTRALGRGYEVICERVESGSAMREALDRTTWDVVISDYTLPGFGAPAALAIVKERGLDLPFIIVSGAVGEESAVSVMRAGAHDFIVKDKLARMLPVLERELREAARRAEHRAMQEQLLISDRMASVGTLAAGVAHEINNPLAVVIANLDFARNDLALLLDDACSRESSGGRTTDTGDSGWAVWLASRAGQILETLGDAKEASEHVRVVVRDLKLFSRSEDEQRGPIDLRRVIESALRMAWNELRHRARVVKDDGNVPAVEANEGRLAQVLLNLLVNAAQAIPEGDADRNEIRITTRLETGDRVVVEVRDTGSGIPQEILGRVFDPFFTTKPMGTGTGLGLAICHRIVTSFGGDITVESTVGEGTAIRVSLPLAKVAKTDAPPLAAIEDPRRRGRILVVDDEAMVAKTVHRILRDDHDVVIVTSGREAADRVQAGERFDLILCDLMMPRMTGMELHAQLVGVASDQAERMIFMTGGAFSPRARQFLDETLNPRIEKPIDVPNLRALVHNMLR